MAPLGAPNRSIALHLAPNIFQDRPTCSQDRPKQPNFDSTWPSWPDFLRFGFHSGSQTFKKPLKTGGFQGFLIFSLTARKPPKSSKIDPKSSQNRAKIPSWLHLAASWAASWRSWAPSWLVLGLLSPSCGQRCRNTAPTGAETAQIRASITQNDL